tara:strand:- start:703 stop:1176 length:474 start_codon:yes stop_codon:yes gene_type:complete
MNALQVFFFSSVIFCSFIGCSSGPSYENAVNSESSSTSINASYEGASSANQGVYLFDYDSSNINPAVAKEVRLLAKMLNENSSLNVRIEGHCDERGTREYNLALGERRAQSVSDLLIINGINSSRVTTVSYGEEKPLSSLSTLKAWAQNRRVEVKAF